ncbi:PA14 domain-containing protein [Vulcanisaeta sp. JCM 14467]
MPRSNLYLTLAVVAMVITLLFLIAVIADVIYVYNAAVGSNTKTIISTAAGSYSSPCGVVSSWQPTSTGFSSTITAITLSTANGYVIHVPTPLVKLSTYYGGKLTMGIKPNNYVSSASVNGTTIYPGTGSLSLGVGTYMLYENATITTPLTSPITLYGTYNYTPAGGVTYIYTFTETIQAPSADVMNLLDGYQAWYVPHVYQGDDQGSFTTSWPVYYGPSTSPSNYWYYISTSINQPILKMVSSAYSWSSGAMFWQEYYSGGTITITMIGVYSNNGTPSSSRAYPYVGDGYIVYLFLKPTAWGINSASNYTIPYRASNTYTGFIVSPVQGDVMFPQSSSTYLVIEWNPLWQYAYTTNGATGQWNVWVVSTYYFYFFMYVVINPYPSPNLGSPYHGWDGIGTGYFQPNPGDYICITVSYNPSTNTLSGIAYDMNTGQSASFTLNLNGYFTPPASGNYVFGVAGTNGAGQANWGIVYVNYQG